MLTGLNLNQFRALLQQVQWHRIAVLFHSKIKAHLALLPPGFSQQLKILNARMHKRSLDALYALETISDKFTHNDVRFLAFKGVILSQQLYATPIMRSGKDIDLFIHPDDIVRANAALVELGYQLITPLFEPGSDQFSQYMIRQKDAVYISHDNATEIEIHWRLDINPLSMAIDFDQWWNRRQNIAITGINIATFDKIDAYCHLAMHGSISMWGRLCWLCDWWAICQEDNFDWPQFHHTANQRGIERMVALPMLLVENIFKAQLPSPYNSLKPNFSTRATHDLIMNNLPNRTYPTTWRRVIARTTFRSDFAYKFSYCKSTLRMLIAGERKLFS